MYTIVMHHRLCNAMQILVLCMPVRNNNNNNIKQKVDVEIPSYKNTVVSKCNFLCNSVYLGLVFCHK